MARRTFNVVDVTEVLVHWYVGRSNSEIAASLGLDRKTVRKYVAPALVAGLTPGGRRWQPGDWEKLLRRWFPELADTRLRQTTWPEIEKHLDYIKSMLGVVRMSTIWQRLRDEHGLQCSVASFRRYVRANLPETFAGPRWWCCAKNPSPAPRRRSATGISATGSTRSAGGGAGSGRS